ncbi:hypothetical protein L6164_023175 [Bauhinia variegata]|nr:hypothetical protein L6164_023175 [Bauhinia variegata]
MGKISLLSFRYTCGIFYPLYFEAAGLPCLYWSVLLSISVGIPKRGAALPSHSNRSKFIVQLVLVFWFAQDLPFCLFVQTVAFVAFTKVITAQYFVWFFCLLPLILPWSKMKLKWGGLSCVLLWMGAQGHWLIRLHQLESGFSLFSLLIHHKIALLAMDWYYGNVMNDLLVPKDQDLLDRLPSPDSWSNWGVSASEGFDSPKKFCMMDTSPREVDFNFNDESFNSEIEIESSLHDKNQSSSSSVCGRLPEQSFQQTALSCGQPNYQLQDLSRFERMEDIYLNSLFDDLLNVENRKKSICFSPEFQCGKIPGGSQKDNVDTEFAPCKSESMECLDIEALPVEVFDSKNNGDEDTLEQSLLEESILKDLEVVITQMTEKTRICFRDALYRLARNTNQQHVMDQQGDLNMEKAMPEMDNNETVRSVDKKPMESETNSVDRAIASLMYNKMEINMQDRPLTTSLTKGTRGKSSKAAKQEQNFHYPNTTNLLRDAEFPGFGGSNKQTASESHSNYSDPAKKCFMLEFG